MVNACVGVGVARAIQLPTLALAAAALGGLVLYDTVSVYGLVAPAAAAGNVCVWVLCRCVGAWVCRCVGVGVGVGVVVRVRVRVFACVGVCVYVCYSHNL